MDIGRRAGFLGAAIGLAIFAVVAWLVLSGHVAADLRFLTCPTCHL
jgi:hypothetical protein